MKDWIFYPLILLVLGGIVAFALNLGGPREARTVEDIRLRGYGLSGAELIDLTASPGTELIVSESAARAVQVQSRSDAPPSAGVFLTLPPVAEEAFGGRQIVITWRLRRSIGFGQVELGYFTLGQGDSAWSVHEVDEGWQDVSFTFTPAPPVEEGFDYAGLWPGVGDPDGSYIEIQSVRVALAD